MNKKKKAREFVESNGLCYRCEYRARFFETGHGPRYECQQPSEAVCGCYMYRPVRPCITTKQNNDDIREVYDGPMVAARSRLVRVADDKDVQLNLHPLYDKDTGVALLPYWEPIHESV